MAPGGLDRLDGLGVVSVLATRALPAGIFADSSGLVGDATALRRRAAADGYLWLRGLVEPGVILELRHRVLGVCDAAGWLRDGAAALDGVATPGARVDGYDDPRMLAFQREVMLLDDLPALRRHPAILSVLDALCGEPAEPTLGDVPRVAFPRAPDLTTPPHQDHAYVKGETDLWTVWVPLGECPRELGVLSLVSGSHRGGLLPHPPAGVTTEGAAVPEDSVWAAGDLACGDVVMFHCLTVHAACENVSDRLRLSIDFRYRPARPRPPAPFVAGRGARLVHRRDCAWVARIAEPDRVYFERPAEAEGQGLAGCPSCEPSIVDGRPAVVIKSKNETGRCP